MCLEKDHWFPKISWKPIKCYKLLCENEGKFYCPWYPIEVILNRPIKANRNLFSSLFTEIINGQGVHAYIDYERALSIYNHYRGEDKKINPLFIPPVYSNIKLYEAVIPPFTFYWKGKFFDDIAARELIVTKEVPL